jgi:hypothetical protein
MKRRQSPSSKSTTATSLAAWRTVNMCMPAACPNISIAAQCCLAGSGSTAARWRCRDPSPVPPVWEIVDPVLERKRGSFDQVEQLRNGVARSCGWRNVSTMAASCFSSSAARI